MEEEKENSTGGPGEGVQQNAPSSPTPVPAVTSEEPSNNNVGKELKEEETEKVAAAGENGNHSMMDVDSSSALEEGDTESVAEVKDESDKHDGAVTDTNTNTNTEGNENVPPTMMSDITVDGVLRDGALRDDDGSDSNQKNAGNGKDSNEAPSKKARMDLHSLPTRQYLDQTVVPILLQALASLSKERPSEPIDYLAAYLMKHKVKYES